MKTFLAFLQYKDFNAGTELTFLKPKILKMYKFFDGDFGDRNQISNSGDLEV